ncbi:ATP-binding protein [Sulfitobacter sp. S0837]|uniref:ATP-binding protein n=1 Tax=Sulfitobacter maritimus TaxID=2741719 RepID=UPI001581E243|nr:ATP-binding protein [Sulfitobacter maritimus]NUH65365.1 ATP-binding protein [Sulfitobacter maritimus]
MSHPSAVPPPLLNPFAFTVESSPLATRKALRRVLDALQPLALDPEVASTVELVLAEALNNIVEHAYPDPKTPGPIHLACHHAPDGLHFHLRDTGLPMPGGQPPLSMAQTVDSETEDLPEGGFGWFLIRDLAKDLTYRRVNRENHLGLRLAVALSSQACASASDRPD